MDGKVSLASFKIEMEVRKEKQKRSEKLNQKEVKKSCE